MILFFNKVAEKSVWVIFWLSLLTVSIFAYGDGEVSYRYDAAGRLISANYGDALIAYSYDSSGNLLRREVKNLSIDSIGEVTETSASPTDINVSVGDDNIALASFGLQNSSDDPVDLFEISINLSGGSSGNVSELRLILDANTNMMADTGELVLANVSSVPSSGILVFTLLSALTLDAGEALSFVLIADF